MFIKRERERKDKIEVNILKDRDRETQTKSREKCTQTLEKSKKMREYKDGKQAKRSTSRGTQHTPPARIGCRLQNKAEDEEGRAPRKAQTVDPASCTTSQTRTALLK